MGVLPSIPKRAQIWGMDLVVAVLIFSLALSFFYLYILNDRDAATETIETLQYRGKLITDSLLGEGSPDNWNSSDVFEIGITSNGKINETKLEWFYNLSVTDYTRTKELFNVADDYYFFLDQNMSVYTLEIEGIGKPGVTKDTITARNLIKVNRVTVYKNKPIGATLYIWQT